MKLSADMGHEDTKFYDGSEVFKITTILGEPQGDLIGSNNREEIETDDGHWYLGQTALRHSLNRITGKDEMWSFTPEYRALLFYGLAQYISTETDSMIADLVLSLPISDYRRNRSALSKLLKKSHLVKFPNTNRRPLTINVRNLFFLPQGFAPAKPYLGQNKLIVTLDLGSRNINYATFNGAELIDSKTDSVEGGATQVLVDIGKKIEQRTRRELTIPQLVETLQTKTVSSFGQAVDVSDIISERMSYYLRSIESLVSRIWGNTADINKIVVFGGGALLAGDMLQKKYPQAAVLDNPQYATVISQFDYLKRKLTEA